MIEYRFAKTENRSVIGTMNDFSILADANRLRPGADDLLGLSLQLARERRAGSLRNGHGYPDRELLAIVERARVIGWKPDSSAGR